MTYDAVDNMGTRLLPAILAGLVVPGGGYLVRGHERRAALVLIVVLALGIGVALSGAGGHIVPFYACLALAVATAFGAFLGAVLSAPGAPRSAGATLALVTVAALLSIAVQVTLRATVVEMFLISSSSMAPTLVLGDHIVVDKRAVTPERGDLVVFRAHTSADAPASYVKRVVAVGGDRIAFKNDVPVVNGMPAPQAPKGTSIELESGEPAQVSTETIGGVTFQILRTEAHARDTDEVLLGPGELYVVGDNRDNSHDSRFTGPVKLSDVVGTARFVWRGRAPNRFGVRLR